MDDLWTEQQFHEMLEARQLLAAADFPPISGVLVCSSVGLAVQALLTGSCLQMVRMYFRTRKDDPFIAKLGIGWIIFVLMLCVALANLQQAMVISQQERFTAWQYQDFWVYQLEILCNSTLFAPTLLFFVRRAYYLWDRNRSVYIVGSVLVLVSFIVNITALGLQRPAGGFEPISNQEYLAAIPRFIHMMDQFIVVKIASEVVQLVTTGSLCILTCYGIYRHRNGYKAFDSAVSRIAFVSGESLFPMFALNVASLTLPTAGAYTSTSVMLPLVSMSPAIYAHALLTALTSRERVREILQAEPVREMEPFSTSPYAEKIDLEANLHGSNSQKTGGLGLGFTGDNRVELPITVLVESRGSHSERRRRGWSHSHPYSRGRHRGHGSRSDTGTNSLTGIMYPEQSRSTAPAPLSPGGGTSTALTSGIVGLASPGRQMAMAGLPATPGSSAASPTPRPALALSIEPSDPLIKDGAIVRPPLSPTSQTDLLQGSQREQAAVRRALQAVSAAARGDRAWSSSAGQVPLPRSPALDQEHDEGLDIFEVLLHGPTTEGRR